MTDHTWDATIVGQGLAGTTLAWHLLQAGQRVMVIDAEAPVTSSKIAAGLITPITGQRMVPSWRVDEFLPVAEQFYRGIEQRTGHSFFHHRTAWRLFSSVAEQQIWPKRAARPACQPHLVLPQPQPVIDATIVEAGLGGFAMHAAQLDVVAYLHASRTAFAAAGGYSAMTLDWQRDVSLGTATNTETITVGPHRTRRLISCEGYAAKLNPYFAAVPFKAAKGEVLTVRMHQPMPCQALHRDLWVAPTATPDVFRVGSTYDWATLDQVPTVTARDQIERKLQAFLRVPYSVLDHQAAVRPIIQFSKGVMGLHPQHQRLGYFNGLGSKGALQAPLFARDFAACLIDGAPLPDEQDLRRFVRTAS